MGTPLSFGKMALIVSQSRERKAIVLRAFLGFRTPLVPLLGLPKRPLLGRIVQEFTGSEELLFVRPD